MRRVVGRRVPLLALIGASLTPAGAQHEAAHPGRGEAILTSFGYPKFAFEVGPDGIAAPAS